MAPITEKDDGKRKRGALSCAECRRLKLKCDRVFPCSSCRKRGCAAICPDGALTAGKLGGRFILANTEELHNRISQLQGRIAQLEEALGAAHALTTASTERHPLLLDELLALKMPIGSEIRHDRPVTSDPPHIQIQKQHADPETALESFGTLKIGEGGVSTFYGSTVGSEFLLEKTESDEETEIEPETSTRSQTGWFPTEISHLAHAFPFATLQSDAETVKTQLRDYLPPTPTCLHLCQSYFNYAAWMYGPILRNQFYDDIFSPLYDPRSTKTISSHNLALMYSVLALGCLVDLQREPYHPDAENYHQLARAALSVESCLEHTTIAAVQTLLLMAYYNQMSDKKTGPTLTWSLNGLAVKLAQAIGLHRDWGKWGLPAEETELRRLVFWEVLVFDSWSAIGFGRPPSQAMQFVDCQQTVDPTLKEEITASWGPLKYSFTRILLDIVNTSFAATPPTYDKILALDARLRDFYIPAVFQVAGINDDATPRPPGMENLPLDHQFSSHSLTLLRENALTYLHRSFFANALSEHPEDPFKSPYAASVLACHRSSCAIIILVRKLHGIEPRLLVRLWWYWVHSFTAAVILASIVTKTPHSNLAPSSLHHLNLVRDLFKEAKSGSRPAGTLPMLLKIHQRAHDVYAEYQNTQGASPVSSVGSGKESSPLSERDDQLEPMLAGKTRLVKKKVKMAGKPTKGSTSGVNIDSMTGVHPNLLEHFQTYNTPRPTSQLGIPPIYLQPGLCPTSSQIISDQGRDLDAGRQTYNFNPATQSMHLGAGNAGASYSAGDFGLPTMSFGSMDYSSQSQTGLSNRGSAEDSFMRSYEKLPGNWDSPGGHWQPAAPVSLQGMDTPINYPAVPLSQPGFVPPISDVQQPGISFMNSLRDLGPMIEQGSSGQGHSITSNASQSNYIGGLTHSGGVGVLDQSWRSFLSRMDMPLAPIPQPTT